MLLKSIYSLDYQTNIPFSIGDVNTYPGKLKLILSFTKRHNVSGSLSNYQQVCVKYTTVAGVDGFDGRAKKPKAVVKAIV
jgi:thioredoxin reductase (NADPH)